MKSILFVDACIRSESRTRELAKAYLEERRKEYETVRLSGLELRPLDEEALNRRDALLSEGELDDPSFALAHQFASAEEIVIAAPFYDCSFPSILKVYFENISITGICFEYQGERPVGLCKAKRLVYVYTSGGPLFSSDQALPYIQSLCGGLFGIPEIVSVKAEGLDIDGVDAKQILKDASEKAKAFARK